MKNTYCRFYNNDIEAKRSMQAYNKSLTPKYFHKYFRVMIDGPDDNFAVVDFKTARDMQVPYQM